MVDVTKINVFTLSLYRIRVTLRVTLYSYFKIDVN